MKKTFFLILFVLFAATGCDGTYNLEIYNNRFKEDIVVAEDNPSNWFAVNKNGVSFNDLLSEEYTRDNYYYDKEMITNNTTMGLKYTSDFSIDSYGSVAIPYRCYQYFNVIDEGNDIVISTSNKNLCYDQYEWLDKITINVKTNHQVLDHNADSVKDSTYTWYLTRENASDKSIQIRYSETDLNVNYDNENIKSRFALAFIIIGVILLAGIILLVFKFTQKRANKI